MRTQEHEDGAAALVPAAFLLLLLAGGLLFLILPKQTVSAAEKRRLAARPEFTGRAILSGRTGKAIDRYYSDHFEFRDALVSLASAIKSARGIGGGDYQVVDTSKPVQDRGPQPRADTRPGPDATASVDEYADIKSVIVYKGKAVQISIGSRATAARFAGLVNAYHRELGPNVRVYVMAIPVGSDFYLPQAVNNGEKRELKNVQEVYSALEPGITPVDAYDELARHQAEYVYYRTDHHWTARGAYYAYRSFAVAAHLHALDSRFLRKGTIPGFLGSLYYYTNKNSRLKDSVDTVYYYEVPNQTAETIYRSRNAKGVAARTYQGSAKGANAYAVFLGGDAPVVRIVSRGAGSRRILVIKDSYGNALAPYLAANYGEVWVVDYRTFWGSISQLIKDRHIDDILFAHNTYVLNGRAAITRETRMLGEGANGTALAADH